MDSKKKELDIQFDPLFMCTNSKMTVTGGSPVNDMLQPHPKFLIKRDVGSIMEKTISAGGQTTSRKVGEIDSIYKLTKTYTKNFTAPALAEGDPISIYDVSGYVPFSIIK